MSNQRFAPYSKRLCQHPDLDSLATIFVAMGQGAWERGKEQGSPTLVLPDDTEPQELAWPVAGYPVVIVRCSDVPEHREQQLAASLLRDGADSVMAPALHGPFRQYVEEVQHG